MKECNQCGKCCTLYGPDLAVLDSEIDWWENHAPDIANYARGGKIWISPITGERMLRCPWLRKLPGQDKYICRIYYNRPDDCKHYPVTIEQMLNDECEMLEPRDLADLKKAQRTLDLLMADSRPPLSR